MKNKLPVCFSISESSHWLSSQFKHWQIYPQIMRTQIVTISTQHSPGAVHIYLVPWPAPETVGVKLVGVEDMDGTFDAEVMKLTGNL